MDGGRPPGWMAWVMFLLYCGALLCMGVVVFIVLARCMPESSQRQIEKATSPQPSPPKAEREKTGEAKR